MPALMPGAVRLQMSIGFTRQMPAITINTVMIVHSRGAFP